MANTTNPRPRMPRGTRSVTLAFFAALDGVSETQQPAVAAAALAIIRDKLKDRQRRQRALARTSGAEPKPRLARPAREKAKPAAAKAKPAVVREPTPPRRAAPPRRRSSATEPRSGQQ
jgi:hypothetical protein